MSADLNNGTAASRPPLVLVHGAPENASIWWTVLEQLDRDDVFTLSPPGFGVPLPTKFEATVSGYRDWLIARQEEFQHPVDVVGHDWGGMHAVQVAMHRPDLIRSWVSDSMHVWAPDYVGHPLAHMWQKEGDGEAKVAEMFGATFEQRLATAKSVGMSGAGAERAAAGFSPEMGRAVLSLLRSARQPVMAESGQGLAQARRRPGLALIATGNPNAAVEWHRWSAEQADAEIALLEGAPHFWPEQPDTRPAVEALTRFWAGLSSSV